MNDNRDVGNDADGPGGLRPLCFVLMPFGVKADPNGRDIDFDRVYEKVIAPAVGAARLDCVRADEEKVGGIIHKAMYERLMLCDFAVADLTLANANVFYELGVRHAVRPFSTVLISAKGTRPPFDVRPLRALRYDLDEAGHPAAVDHDVAAVRDALDHARKRTTDSPVFQMVTSFSPPDLSRLNSEAFRDRERALERLHQRIRTAQAEGMAALETLQRGLGDLADVDTGVLVELLLAFRANEAFAQMITLVEQMPADLAELTQVREQHALALNRVGRDREAEQILRDLVDERGPSSETHGLLGRIYKDRWEAAGAGDGDVLAASLLDAAIAEYRAGLDADPTDVYPGINAVELMYLRDPHDPELVELLTVVRYHAELKVRGRATYWECATLLQLAVMGRDREDAQRWFTAALATQPDRMSTRTTADSLRRLHRALPADDADAAWIRELEQALRAVARRERANLP